MKLNVPTCYNICPYFGKKQFKHTIILFAIFPFQILNICFLLPPLQKLLWLRTLHGPTQFPPPTLEVCSVWSCILPTPYNSSLMFMVLLYSFGLSLSFPLCFLTLWTLLKRRVPLSSSLDSMLLVPPTHEKSEIPERQKVTGLRLVRILFCNKSPALQHLLTSLIIHFQIEEIIEAVRPSAFKQTNLPTSL